MTQALSATLASQLARIALDNVGREYPYHLLHLLHGDADALPPRELHPVFHGSYDWHSCVHMHWTLARCLRRFPSLPHATAIDAHLDASLPAALAGDYVGTHWLASFALLALDTHG